MGHMIEPISLLIAALQFKQVSFLIRRATKLLMPAISKFACSHGGGIFQACKAYEIKAK